MNTSRPFFVSVSILLVAMASRAFAEDALDFRLKWGVHGNAAGQFDNPIGIGVDATGNVYVVELFNNRVQKFDSQGNFITKWGSFGFDDSLFVAPQDLAVDAEGNTYVLDGLMVKRYGPTGAFLGSWTRGPYQASGIAVDPNGYIYTVESNGGVRKFTNDGSCVTAWSPAAWATDIAVDQFGDVFVGGQFGISRYSGDGTLITSWTTPEGSYHVASDADGDVYATNYFTAAHVIRKYDRNGTFLVDWGTPGAEDGQFNGPQGLSVDIHGNLFVADSGNHRIQKFSHLNYVSVFADSLGSIDCIRIPQGLSTLHVLGFAGPVSAGGITGAEFRIEVTNPVGYGFTYTPPTGSFVTGNPLDLTPSNPDDPAGSTVLFPTCRPLTPPHMSGDRVDLGTVSVYNYEGGPTDFIVTTKVPPDSPGMPFPRFFLCDSPFNTPVRMSMAEGSDIASRSVMNSLSCEARPGAPTGLTATLQPTYPQSVRLDWQPPTQGHPVAYNVYRGIVFPNFQRLTARPVVGTSFVDTIPSSDCYQVTAIDSIGREGPVSTAACAVPFGSEALYLDARESQNDGAAGPASSGQILESRYQYLITVQGTFSLWPAGNWTGGTTVLCGRPEQSPQTPSPTAVNGWVGADTELNFSVPLTSGVGCSDLASLGYPPHHGRFMIDLGSGPVHLEPIGGTPDGFAPEHRYVYLVRGQDNYARFSLVDSLTSDNYGVLSIGIKFIDPSDTLPVGPPSARLLVLPNIPDPFNPTTEIRYLLPTTGQVSVEVCDVRGRILRRLFSGDQSAGLQRARWDGRAGDGEMLPSGIYFARIRTPHDVASERMTLIK